MKTRIQGLQISKAAKSAELARTHRKAADKDAPPHEQHSAKERIPNLERELIALGKAIDENAEAIDQIELLIQWLENSPHGSARRITSIRKLEAASDSLRRELGDGPN